MGVWVYGYVYMHLYSLYSLQVVDGMLTPGEDAARLRRAVEWRRGFLVTGGLEQVLVL